MVPATNSNVVCWEGFRHCLVDGLLAQFEEDEVGTRRMRSHFQVEVLADPLMPS